MIRLSIRRPVAVAMTYLAVALLGVAAWRNIPLELLPDTELPRLQIRASWPGASPETIEAFLTSPIESTVQQVKGVEKVVSTSFERQGVGIAELEVEFNQETDMNFARLDLSAGIDLSKLGRLVAPDIRINARREGGLLRGEDGGGGADEQHHHHRYCQSVHAIACG